MSDVNVVPVNDLKPHIDGPSCACGPRVECLDNGNRIIVHNSYDGREVLENALDEIDGRLN